MADQDDSHGTCFDVYEPLHPAAWAEDGLEVDRTARLGRSVAGARERAFVRLTYERVERRRKYIIEHTRYPRGG